MGLLQKAREISCEEYTREIKKEKLKEQEQFDHGFDAGELADVSISQF